MSACLEMMCKRLAYLEEVDGGLGVERWLLVDGREDGGLLGLGRVKGGSKVELQALGDLVLELDLGTEQVGGGPCLSVSTVSRGSPGDGQRANCGETPRTWVKVKPFLKSTYLPSMSPAMALDLSSRVPATLNVTLEGVRVLTSREVPWMG